MNKTASASYYIKNQDIEGAIYRFENAINRYKTHWFETIVQIYNSSAEFMKQYVIDPVLQTVTKIIKKTVSAVAKISSSTAIPISHTYFIKMYDTSGKHVFTKIGKANVVKDRMNKLERTTYKDGTQIDRCEIVQAYELSTEDKALAVESLMRGYLRNKYTYIPADRFEAFEPTEEDLNTFKRYYEMISAT